LYENLILNDLEGLKQSELANVILAAKLNETTVERLVEYNTKYEKLFPAFVLLDL